MQTRKCLSDSTCESHEPLPLFCQHFVFCFSRTFPNVTCPNIFPCLTGGLQEQLLFISRPVEIFTSSFASISFSFFLCFLTSLLHFFFFFQTFSSSASKSFLPRTLQKKSYVQVCVPNYIWVKNQQPGEVGKYLFLLLISISNIGISQPLSQNRYFFEVDSESSPSERSSLP